MSRPVRRTTSRMPIATKERTPPVPTATRAGILESRSREVLPSSKGRLKRTQPCDYPEIRLVWQQRCRFEPESSHFAEMTVMRALVE
jgi:hypothetical protein